MLTVRPEQMGERLVLHLDGELALESLGAFQEVATMVSEIRIVDINCDHLSFIDSTGVSALLQAALRWRTQGAAVQVQGLSDELYEMLDVMGFFEVLAS